MIYSAESISSARKTREEEKNGIGAQFETNRIPRSRFTERYDAEDLCTVLKCIIKRHCH